MSRNGCWEWVANLSKGYGHVGIGGRTWKAHRASYESLVGPIPDGLVIDHLCRFTACVNPEHLEPVTPSVNGLRSPLHSTRRIAECEKGHPMTGGNLGIDGRKVRRRFCRTCKADWDAAYRERKLQLQRDRRAARLSEQRVAV